MRDKEVTCDCQVANAQTGGDACAYHQGLSEGAMEQRSSTTLAITIVSGAVSKQELADLVMVPGVNAQDALHMAYMYGVALAAGVAAYSMEEFASAKHAALAGSVLIQMCRQLIKEDQ